MKRNDTSCGRITIVGAGAIGGTVGAYLHKAGHDVLLVDASGEHVERVRSEGLEIAGARGTESFKVPIVHTEEFQQSFEDEGETLGTTLLCVKAHHTESALRMLVPMLDESGCIVSLQNGMNEDLIREAVGEERTVGTFVHFGADLISPGQITLGYEETIRVGELDGSISPRTRTLSDVLSDAMPAEPTTEVWGYLWGKMVFAAAGYAVSCVDASVSEVLDDPGGRRAAFKACSEAYEVGCREVPRLKLIGTFDPKAFGSALEQPEVGERELERLADTWRDQIKKHMGIWRDLRVKRRKTEGEAQLGPVIQAGKLRGVSTPVLRAVLSVVTEIEKGERGMDWENLREIEKRGDSQCS